MKNLLLITLSIFFVFIQNQSFSQIVTPDSRVCPEETVEYTINSSYYGEQTYRVINGVFIVPDSVYYTAGDSTGIIFTASSSNNKIKIRWGHSSLDGTLRWYDQYTSFIDQDFEIGIVHPPRFALGEGDKIILNGNNTFQIQLTGASYINYEDQMSTNITRNYSGTKIENIIGGRLFTFAYNISGNQSGWVRFRTKNINVTRCSSYSAWDTIYINRKLNKPAISGNPTICTQRSYSISVDPQSHSFTWTVTNGLKIFMNNQYLNTYTGTETTVPIYKPENSRGAAEIKVKAFGTGYIDSDETTKQVWFGPPAVYAFGNHLVDAMTGMPMYDFCYGTHNDCQAVHPSGEAFIEEWQWQGTSATIYPYGYAYQYATIYPNDYSSFGVEIRARNECGWSEWSRMWVTAINCSSYFMIMSPNPADSYVELNFIEEMEVKDKTNKIEIKKDEKSKDGNLDEYLIQIMDKNGTVRKSVQSNSMKLNIPTHDLEPGNYFLRLNIGTEVYKQQLIIY